MSEPFAAPSAYDYPLLIRHLLTTSMMCTPDQEIVSGTTLRYDYRTFRERIGRLANGLASLGVRMGNTVAVMDWDGHRYLECFFGVPMMGAILHTINIRLSPEQVLYTINHADDDVILVHEDFVPFLEQISSRIERPVKLVLLQDGPARDDVPDGYDAEYEALLAGSGSGFVFEDFDENTRATTFYTTGTTGDPKGVAYSHRQLVLHTLGAVAGFSPAAGSSRLHRGDVYMPITPMFHVHGWGFPYVATMLGMKQVYPGRYDPPKILRLIAEEGVTFSHCVPTILHMILSAPEAQDVDLTGWKVVIGGSALPQGLAQAALDRGIDVFAAYGLSETCPLLTTAAISEPQDLAARCQTGRPGPLVDLRVVDADMNGVPHDGETTGEVVVRAPWLTQGYVKNPEGSEALWQGGYLHTGDVGYIDCAGTLQITDRMKDVIKSGGEWISSLELENLASQCPGVGEVAAIGIPDERWGERPMLIVVRAADHSPEISGDDIRDVMQPHVDSGRLSKWAVPQDVEFVEALDKTSVGKLDKKVLRARYAGETGS
ncbi:MAG: fatty acid--CoA ligase [Hyphomicrobiaceae bacterium]